MGKLEVSKCGRFLQTGRPGADRAERALAMFAASKIDLTSPAPAGRAARALEAAEQIAALSTTNARSRAPVGSRADRAFEAAGIHLKTDDDNAVDGDQNA